MRDRLTRWYHNSILFEIRGRLRAARTPRVSRTCRSYIVDAQTHEIQPNVVMETYWVEPPVGPGPGASIYICGDEVMRFDCFGGDVGHYHFNVRQSKFLPFGETTRIYYPTGSVYDQIERAAFDLRRNLDYARGMNLHGDVRNVQIDQVAVDGAAEILRDRLTGIATDRAVAA